MVDMSFKWWVQRDGTRISLADMTEEHIMNSVNMIDRRGGWRAQWKEPLLKELESRTSNECFKIK